MKKQTVTLPEAIKRGTKSIKTIELQEPTVLALQGLETMGVIRGDVAQLCILLPRITDLTDSEVRGLCFKNIAALSMRITRFLES